MSDREKLIELLGVSEEYSCCYGDIVVGCTGCEYEKEEDCVLARLADHLISNGVTVQKWIPVSERLPTEEDADEYETVYAISKGSYPKQWHWTKVAEIPDHFTHWMPLPPEPPKECE